MNNFETQPQLETLSDFVFKNKRILKKIIKRLVNVGVYGEDLRLCVLFERRSRINLLNFASVNKYFFQNKKLIMEYKIVNLIIKRVAPRGRNIICHEICRRNEILKLCDNTKNNIYSVCNYDTSEYYIYTFMSNTKWKKDNYFMREWYKKNYYCFFDMKQIQEKHLCGDIIKMKKNK